jgi:hypothetical protein
MLVALTEVLEEDLSDLLRRAFSELELGNKWSR